MPIRTLTVIGTRPEAIKLAPVVHALEAAAGRGVVSRVCATGQHREMLQQTLDVFRIRPHHSLDVMTPGQSPAQAAAAVLTSLGPVLQQESPDWVIVQGDTTTVAAASLAAFYAGIRVAHVEAGLRTHSKWAPFPEEINRRIAGVIADLHCAPTNTARDYLLRENVPAEAILVTGNPVVDALQWVVAQGEPAEFGDFVQRFKLPQAGRNGRPKLLLMTAHRRESFGAPLREVFAAVRQLSRRYGPGMVVLYPVHLNPQVRHAAQEMLGDLPNVVLTPPLDYLTLVNVMRLAHIVLTDSGGIQEEAPSLGVPVLVLRDVTERPEAIEAGAARLVGTRTENIVAEVTRLWDDDRAYASMARAVNPYGDGRAAARIVGALLGDAVEPFSVEERQPAVTQADSDARRNLGLTLPC